MGTTLYCECIDCKHHNGASCGLDFITINIDFECSGFEPKSGVKVNE